MSLDAFGFEWPFSPFWLWTGCILFVLALLWHARVLFVSTTPRNALRLIALRIVFAGLLLFLISRPFIENEQPDPSSIRVVSLVDLSGSMNQRDQSTDHRRLDQARNYLDLNQPDSWINRMRESFGLVQRMGFSGDDVFSLKEDSWGLPQSGKPTALGTALSEILEETHPLPLAGVTVFSDGRNNLGSSPIAVGQKYLERGIPVNVIGVGQTSRSGNLSVRFVDAPVEAKAKEELGLVVEVTNSYPQSCSSTVRLLEDDDLHEEIPITVASNETRLIKFSPLVPDRAGRRNYRVMIDSLEGDDDPSDDADFRVVMIREPDLFSVLYLSNQARPIYPFIKHSLSGQSFQLSALIRLGEETFHARGEKVSPEGYPSDPDFWMQYDVVILDLECLGELNSTLVSSLRQYVEKRGGGLLTFGSPLGAREKLGGVFPALQFEEIRPKQSVSLEVDSDPLFSERKRVNQWKAFLPGGMPAFLISEQNPASLGIVGLRSDRKRSALVVQAYGSGKSAYWGSSHDWKRALLNEDRSKEFTNFWQSLVQWLGSGSVERVRLPVVDQAVPRGEMVSLNLQVLGSNFEPSMDALIDVNVSGPGDFSQQLKLFPRSGRVGSYSGEFRPSFPGSYRIGYNLRFPDGETLEETSYIRVEEHGLEAGDSRYAEQELRMLANLTGGEFVHISNLSPDWKPQLSNSLPTVKRRNDLASFWPLALALFLTAGIEWIWRRKKGLR